MANPVTLMPQGAFGNCVASRNRIQFQRSGYCSGSWHGLDGRTEENNRQREKEHSIPDRISVKVRTSELRSWLGQTDSFLFSTF